MAQEYITLVSSLPHLPYFERAERLPITERALLQRMSMLTDDDRHQLQQAIDLLRWKRHSVAVRTEEIEKQYRAFMQSASNAELRGYVDWEIGGRAALAAMRLKLKGQQARPDKPWGAGRLVLMIHNNWEKANVGADALFPWISEARQLLESREAMPLERLKMKVVWNRLTRMGETNPFGFEYVAAYAFKWDIVRRWIAYDPVEAGQRFSQLVKEVIGEQRLACG